MLNGDGEIGREYEICLKTCFSVVYWHFIPSCSLSLNSALYSFVFMYLLNTTVIFSHKLCITVVIFIVSNVNHKQFKQSIFFARSGHMELHVLLTHSCAFSLKTASAPPCTVHPCINMYILTKYIYAKYFNLRGPGGNLAKWAVALNYNHNSCCRDIKCI